MGVATSNIFDHPLTNSASFYPANTSFAILVPRPLLDRPIANGTFELCQRSVAPGDVFRTEMLLETVNTITIVMFLGLLFLLLISYRSTNAIKWDFFRITGLYLVGTLGVPISVFAGPQVAGFNRIEGFGILIHNFAEWFVMGSLWMGAGTKQWERCGFCAVLTYVWIMLTLISLMSNLSVLFLLLMIQGAALDWCMTFSFILAASRLSKERAENKFFWWGFAGALTHILSIQPLFFGFALSRRILNGITIIFLVPTFMFYILFSVMDSPMPGTVIGPPKTGLLPNQTEVLWQLVNTTGDQDLKSRGPAKQDTQDKIEQEVSGSNVAGALGYDPEVPETFLRMPGSISGLINEGMVHRYEDGKKMMIIIVTCGILTSIGNSFLVWFSPRMFSSSVRGWYGCV